MLIKCNITMHNILYADVDALYVCVYTYSKLYILCRMNKCYIIKLKKKII